MSNVFFDDLEHSEQSNPNLKPIWAMNLDDESQESAIHKWLMGELQFLKEENKERFQEIQRNIAIYKGIQYQSQDLREGTKKELNSPNQKIVANNIYDLVSVAVSKLVKYKPNVSVLPTQDEFSDRIGAEMTEQWLKHIWYTYQFDGHIDPVIKELTKIMGEAYLFIEWDPNAGDLHPEFKEKYAEDFKRAGKAELLNEKGEPELDSDGKPIVIDQPVYNGDVSYKIKMTTDVLVHRAESFKKAEYIFYREVMPIEEARLLYPKKAAHIKHDQTAIVFDFEKMMARKSHRNEVVIWHFYHKRTKALDKGRYIVFTTDGILHNAEFPFTHKHLPCVRLTDLDLPGELHGESKIGLVKGLTGAYNNLTNMILRNQVLVAHPKWMMPAGAAKLESLGNDITIVQYKGPQAPQLVSASPTPPEVFNFRGELKEEFRTIYGQGQVQAGNPPPGIKAGIALQFLAEQESERSNKDVLKSNEFVKEVAQMTIAVAGDYYDNDDQRQVRVLGKQNKWKTIFFDVANLSKDYDIRVQNSSALPESKAARTQTLMDLKEQFPALISDEQFLDLLDLAQDQKFMDIGTVSIRAAEAENEMLLDPNPAIEPKDPEEYEDLLAHWKVHAKAVREWSYKNMTPELQQERMKDHILATEMLIEARAKLNPAFAEQVMALPGYPLFFKPNMIAEADEQALMAEEAQGGMEQMQPAPQPEGPYPPEQEEPVNPELGGTPQEEVAQNVPSLDAQAGGVPPVEPSSQI